MSPEFLGILTRVYGSRSQRVTKQSKNFTSQLKNKDESAALLISAVILTREHVDSPKVF